jgi:hypothetical protein
MRPVSRFGLVAIAGAALATAASGQLNIPPIVILPTEDFVWTWGDMRPIDDLEEPEFEITGIERAFRCTAKGNFKPGSHLRDVYEARQFEQSLMGSITFIQTTTATLNNLYLSNDLQWAVLECIIPESVESEEEAQERVDRAMERAERERQRRREREEEQQAGESE